MSTVTQFTAPPTMVYPESDGRPMADNTVQFQWITTIQGGLDAVFRENADVFVAGDLLWYPVEGDNTIRTAPDVMVVFGRQKGHRGSYQQWLESNIAPQVVFEVISPGNRHGEMVRKFQFYEQYGVEEYYAFDPEHNELSAWTRQAGRLRAIPNPAGWASPRLGVRFDLTESGLKIYGPDGRPFATYVELVEQREQERQRADRLTAQLRAMGAEPQA